MWRFRDALAYSNVDLLSPPPIHTLAVKNSTVSRL